VKLFQLEVNQFTYQLWKLAPSHIDFNVTWGEKATQSNEWSHFSPLPGTSSHGARQSSFCAFKAGSTILPVRSGADKQRALTLS
jgi:hypothetical protein